MEVIYDPKMHENVCLCLVAFIPTKHFGNPKIQRYKVLGRLKRVALDRNCFNTIGFERKCEAQIQVLCVEKPELNRLGA